MYDDEMVTKSAADTRPRVIAGSTGVANALDVLAKRLDQLNERLVAVVQPQEPTLRGEEINAVPAPRSPLARDLESFEQRIRQYADEIGGLIDRLEV